MRIRLIIFLLFGWSPLFSQPVLRTIVPADPVVAGTSFQVQYILEGTDKTVTFKTPDFSGFRLIAGPNIYKGAQSVQNAVFTLEAVRPGQYRIPGGEARSGSQSWRSEQKTVQVQAAGETVNMDEIRKGLFMKVTVNRKSCFVGEPVLVSFTLYSKLESSSDITKNPGFYGFAVSDIVSLNEQQMQSEKINGETYDAHLIRQVQIFPQQAGLLTVDEMEISNTVYIIRESGSQKPQQKIFEGVHNDPTAAPPGTRKEVHFTLHSEPQYIQVKALPQPAPVDFSGAVGQFKLHADFHHPELYKNEGGLLTLRLEGSGNLNQLVMPVVKWPAGFETFEAQVRDSILKKNYPLSGSRIFELPFNPPAPGEYKTTPVRFSYFDPVSGAYKSVQSEPLTLSVKDALRKPISDPAYKPASFGNKSAAWIGAAIVVLVVLGFLTYWLFIRKEHPEAPLPAPKIKVKTVEEFLPDINTVEADVFLRRLENGMTAFLQQYLPGTSLNRGILLQKLGELGLSSGSRTALDHYFGELDLLRYSGVNHPDNPAGYLEQAHTILTAVAAELPAEI